ncbi:hypothetical protein PREVCOP_04644 [Segatella copri DSM 18205]|uniref:Uncharacterized protein n=1 Tax=Segatella copri DSM 18205 TaxID=537011 RepID=D1PBR4_9BACT|nr:hypothetical protein PREVCOP_04644 [Segatella copri DSM 18205]
MRTSILLRLQVRSFLRYSFQLHFDCKVTKNKLNCLYKRGSF